MYVTFFVHVCNEVDKEQQRREEEVFRCKFCTCFLNFLYRNKSSRSVGVFFRRFTPNIVFRNEYNVFYGSIR